MIARSSATKNSRRRLGRHRADDAARHQEAEGVDRIGRVRHQHDVARRGDRLRHVGEAFLRAEGGDHLRLGIELHAEPARVIARLRAAQAGDAFRGGIAVGARLADRLDQLVEHVLRRGQVRVAHAEIDDVGAAGAGLGLELVDLLEDVRRQAPHAVKVAHRSQMSLGRCPGFAARRAVMVLLASEPDAPQTDIAIAGRRGRSSSAFFAPPAARPPPWRPAERPAASRRACFSTESRSPFIAFELLAFKAGLRRLRRRLEDGNIVEVAVRPRLGDEIGRRRDVGREAEDLRSRLFKGCRPAGRRLADAKRAERRRKRRRPARRRALAIARGRSFRLESCKTSPPVRKVVVGVARP